MPETGLIERIEQGVFLLDGAMGTQLIARGVGVGTCNDYLNISSPDIVCDVHLAYVQAGSDAVITNTFGANKYTLERHGFADKVAAINEAGAKIARQAATDQNYVLGDIGPCGEFLEPLGTLKADELRDAFARQAEALVAGGVDGLIIETMTALDEVTIAVEAAKSVGGGLPVLASMSFDKTVDSFKTMMGVGVEAVADKLVSLGVDAIGFNCGTATLAEYVELARNLVSAVRALSDNIIVFAEPNAGKPELVEDEAVYKVSPAEFAEAAAKIHSAGVSVIGGCCGTSPAHIKAVAKRIRKTK